MRLSAIDANLLAALDALLTERNVTRAAARVGVGQPAMSHALARLREHFGDPLLVPKGRQLALTERGHKLVRPVAAAMAALGDVFVEGDLFVPARSARAFVVAAADLMSLLFLPRLVRRLRRIAPGVTLTLWPLVARSTEAILDNGVELALGVYEDIPATMNQEQLFTDEWVVVMSRRHPAARKAALTLDDYVRHPHVECAPHGRLAPRLDRVLASLGRRRTVAVQVPYWSVIPEVLAAGPYLHTVIARGAARLAQTAELVVRPLPMRMAPMVFSQLWRRSHDDDAGHRWLRAEVARAAGAR
jgi:DNA-binding transcriptional LysR family regulator